MALCINGLVSCMNGGSCFLNPVVKAYIDGNIPHLPEDAKTSGSA